MVRFRYRQTDGSYINPNFTNDVTADKQEEAAKQLLRDVDLQILDGRPVDAIVPLICRRLAEIYGLSIVWFGVKEADGSVSIRAQGGPLKDFIENQRPRWDDSPPGRGPTGRAIRSGQAQVTDWDDPHCPPFREWARQVGHRSTLVIPLKFKGDVVATLSVNSTRENAFEGENRRQISDVAARMSVALGRAHDLSRLRLQGIALASVPNAIVIADRHGWIEWANDSFCRQSGYALEEIAGRTIASLFDGTPGEWMRIAVQGEIPAAALWRGELTQRHKDGHCYIVDQIITPLRGQDGEITHFVTIQEDITARKESERQIEYLAHHDALTGLANRIVFQDHLARALEQARRGGRTLALHLLDLDGFKIVNDSLGHAAGDQFLKIVSELLRSCVRNCDLVARLGGDEFAVIQADPEGADGAASLARRILKVLDRPFALNGKEVHTTASIGITLFTDADASVEQLVTNADIAMYRAKGEGRNNFQFYSPWMHAEIQGRLALENALRTALARQELVLHYQPQLDLESGRISAVEALLRWQHPERGLVMPSDFTRIAEDSGLIVPLGRWVLRQACAQCQAWRAAGLPRLGIHVNVSAAQFTRDDITSAVSEVLAETALPPPSIAVEVTESLLARDTLAAAEALHGLRRLGVQLSLDDFGTGYSSLSNLARFPFDELKIDKSFVRGALTESKDAAIIRAIIGMGHALGMRVVAEGVERPEQERALKAAGCDAIQGYLISPPQSPDRMSEFLSAYATRGPACTSH
jgi:diguanylate cyclase (GGDEF)-like protein/PAS domain S-box-containing protein